MDGGHGDSDGHHDDDHPTEVMEYKGYTYEKPYNNKTALWTCKEPNCNGQLSVIPVRSRIKRHRRVDVRRDARGRLTEYEVRRAHDHPKATARLKLLTGNLQKTEPLQLLRCKQCNIYVAQANYLQHTDTIAHKIAEFYYESKNVQVIKGPCENDILRTRIVSTHNSDSINDFFDSVEVHVINLICYILQLINGQITISIKMFALYQKTFNQNSDNILGDVKTFSINDETITSYTVIWGWFKRISNAFKSHNQNYLETVGQKSYHLVRVRFLEIYLLQSNLQKTEPLQLLRCNQCNMYVVQANYLQHTETIAHKIAELYYESENVQVIKGPCKNGILKTRIVSTHNSESINDFFDTVEVHVINLICYILQLINGQITISIKMSALYQKTFNQNSDNILDVVKKFFIKDETITSYTVIWGWFKRISNEFKSHNQNYIETVEQNSHHLVRVMYLDIYLV